MSFKSELEKLEEIELKAKKDFSEHVRLALEKSKIIHHWGDGHGGYLKNTFEEILSEYISQPSIVSRSKNRPKISSNKRKTVLERDAYRCVNCNSHLDLCVDHICPVSKGGTNDIDNLQTLCRSCNSSKGAKSMYEWRKTK